MATRPIDDNERAGAGDRMDDALRALSAGLPGSRGNAAGLLVARLRATAIAEGRMPVADLADGLAAALIGDRAGTPVASWIEALRHAAALGPTDGDASALLLATVGVRLAH